MKPTERALVTVTIDGDEYRIRASTTPEHTRRCAEYVDRKLAELRAQGTLAEAPRAAILVAMSLADELFDARARMSALESDVAEAARRLADDVESALSD